MTDSEPRGVVSSLAFLALICLGALCAAGFSGDVPSPGPGLATRAVESSETLGPAGKYFAVTFISQPIDVLLLMLAVGITIWLIAALIPGGGN